MGPKVKVLKAEGKFIVIKLAIFLTVWQEMILHILVGKGVIHSPYCYLIGKRSTHCFDLTGFATPSAQRGVRTVATLIIFEMFALSFLMLYFFPFTDECLGKLRTTNSSNDNASNKKKNGNLIEFDNFLRILCFGDILCNLEDSSGGSVLPKRKKRAGNKYLGLSNNSVVNIPPPIMERDVDDVPNENNADANV